MKKILIALLLVLNFQSTIYAMDCNIPLMLEWKYGPIANTKDGVITEWRHATLPQPDAAQLLSDCNEYELPKAKELKLIELEAEMVLRAGAILPWIDSADKVQILKQIYNSGGMPTPTANITSVLNIYIKYTNAKAVIEGYATVAEVEAYDVVTDPTWP